MDFFLGVQLHFTIDLYYITMNVLFLGLKLNGGDMKSVQGDSGHAQMKMVADVYSHIIDEDRRLNARRFEEAFYSGHKTEEELDGLHVHTVEEAASPQPAQQESDQELLMRLLTKSPEMATLIKTLAKSL